jgi:hypothetical protein
MVIRTLAALLLACSIYFGCWAVSNSSPFWFVAVAIGVLTAYGLIMNRVWAKYLWFGIAALVSIFWLVSVGCIAMSRWPYATALESIVSLVPGFVLLAVCGMGSVAVHKHFRGTDSAP